MLNSFFGTRENGQAQTVSLKAWLSSRQVGEPLILVTHQVNITGLTSVVPRSGELVFAMLPSDGTVTVIGRQSTGA